MSWSSNFGYPTNKQHNRTPRFLTGDRDTRTSPAEAIEHVGGNRHYKIGRRRVGPVPHDKAKGRRGCVETGNPSRGPFRREKPNRAAKRLGDHARSRGSSGGAGNDASAVHTRSPSHPHDTGTPTSESRLKVPRKIHFNNDKPTRSSGRTGRLARPRGSSGEPHRHDHHPDPAY